MTKEVTFEPVDEPVNDRIDDAYRAKYRGNAYLSPTIGAPARSATVKIMPRETKPSTSKTPLLVCRRHPGGGVWCPS